MVSIDIAGEDKFLIANTRPDIDYRQKPKGGGWKEPDYVEFQPEDYEKDWVSAGIQSQIKSTVSILQSKPMRQGDQVFYLVSPKAEPSAFEVTKLLDRLAAKVVAYVDRDQNSILLSASNKVLVKLTETKIPKIVGEHVNMIRPLFANEQISPSLKENQENFHMTVISIMPNLETERRSQYTKKIFQFLQDNNCKIYERNLAEDGFIFTDVTLDKIETLVNLSTFIFKVNKVPKATAEQIRERVTIKRRHPIAKPSSFQTDSFNVDHLPKVVLMDSGVNKISQLGNILLSQDSFIFKKTDDGVANDGHGTPIAHLVAYGENSSTPAAGIISYKIYSDLEDRYADRGWIKGIRKYSNVTRLFVTSIGVEGLGDDEFAYLDRLVQKENICFVCSGGNIPPEKVLSYAKQNRYPQYLKLNPVTPPANGVSIVAVGSIAKKTSTAYQSIAGKNCISPHSLCGYGGFHLYECKKPDVMEHGGNVNVDNTWNLNSIEVGVRSINKDGKVTENLSGSSFAAPLFVRKLAEIEGKYKNKIKNSETLKAIAFLASNEIDHTCGGHGESYPFTGCSHNHALYLAEGSVKLSDKKKDITEIPYDQIIIDVPPDVKEIKLCLVHSDDFKKTVSPQLNTYLDVIATKTGSDSIVPPLNNEDRRSKTNVKKLTYSFESKSMEAIWTFKLIPDTTYPIIPEDKKDITVRYGCAILLVGKNTRASKISLTEEIKKRKMLYMP